MKQRTKRGVTRRRVLESGAGLLAAAAAPVRLQASQRGPEPALVSTDLTGRVARYMAAARQQPLPPDVLRETKHRVLDTVAAMISGAKLKPSASRAHRAAPWKRRSSPPISGRRRSTRHLSTRCSRTLTRRTTS